MGRLVPSLAVVALAALAPATASGAVWGAPRTVASSGDSYSPSVALDARGRAAVAYVRFLGGVQRAEVRRGGLRSWLGAPVILDRSTHAVDSTAVAFGQQGLAVTAWRRYRAGNHRLRAATVSSSGRVTGPLELTDGGSSAYDPAFAPTAGGSLLLSWTRRASGFLRGFADGRFGPSLGATGPSPQGFAGAQGGDGVPVAAWAAGGRLVTAQATPAGSFAPPAAIPGAPPQPSAPAMAVTDQGDVVVVWRDVSAGAGALWGALRPAGGAFGPAVELVPASEDARAAAVVGTSAREVLVAYVARAPGAITGGPVRLARFDDALRPTGAPRTLSPPGATVQRLTIGAGASGAFAAWATVGAGPDAVQAIRIAPGGILSHVTTIDRGDQVRPPVLAVNASSQAILAWMRPGGDIRASIRR
jgi:hypothetical protein